MIVKQELVNKLRSFFGLNIYEAKVWLALISKSIASAGEIAEMSGVPRSRTYDVLESLEKQGFVIAKLGKPAKFIVVEPTKVIEKLKITADVDSKEKVRILNDVKQTSEYDELEQLYKEGITVVKKEDLSGAIRGRLNVSSHIKEVLENAANEVIICSDTNYILKNQKFLKRLFERLNKANIKIILGVHGTSKDTENLGKIFNSKIKIKSVNVKGHFFIVDRKEMIFLLSDPEKGENEFAIWLNSDFLAGSIAYLFELAVSGKNNKK